jgi:hypothetical protein
LLAANVDDQLCRSWAGDEVAGAEVVEEFGLADPAAALNDLLPQHGDVGCGFAESGGAEFEEEAGELPQYGSLLGRTRRAFSQVVRQRCRCGRRARAYQLR